jgi:hypothetical protein
MNTVVRFAFAPAIISAYATYGACATVRRSSSGMPGVRRLFSGIVAGAAYGSYYVLTGEKLDSFLFRDEK